MNKKRAISACLIASILLLLNFQLALAHQTVNVGDYAIEIGWVTEPPITGQMNAIVVNVSKGEEPVEDISGLTVSVKYGDQTKTLTLQPLGEDTPGQFVAPILPSIPGQYTIVLGGKLGDTDVSTAVEPEEVEIPDVVQFPVQPSATQSSSLGVTEWLSWLGILFGLIGIGLGVTALRKK